MKAIYNTMYMHMQNDTPVIPVGACEKVASEVGYSGFRQHLQLASHEIATLWHKCDVKRNSKSNCTPVMTCTFIETPIPGDNAKTWRPTYLAGLCLEDKDRSTLIAIFVSTLLISRSG